MAVSLPIEPMLAKIAEHVPQDGAFLFEPKWDGFRAIVFRGPDDVYIQSRDLRPLDRYFPDLHAVFLKQLPSGVVVDGEIVMPTAQGLDFGGLQMRLHPAASRVEKLAKATPAAFVAFEDRKSTRLNSSHANISYAVFCLKKKINNIQNLITTISYNHYN